jgi:hypothetical protein
MKKRSSYYGNVLQRDDPKLGDEDVFWSSPGNVDRFQEKSINTDSNYLYTDVNADRFNAPRVDFEQEQGQPKGVSPKTGPLEDLESSITADEAGELYDPVLKSFSNDEKIIDDIKREKLED